MSAFLDGLVTSLYDNLFIIMYLYIYLHVKSDTRCTQLFYHCYFISLDVSTICKTLNLNKCLVRRASMSCCKLRISLQLEKAQIKAIGFINKSSEVYILNIHSVDYILNIHMPLLVTGYTYYGLIPI